jgi:two-component system, chemotaxis family, chemotaxis protein CheY
MPDAVLLDWKMPGGMDGGQFLEKLRKLANGKHPKVIFCTTESGRVDIQKALKLGADEYIMKPFDRDIMESKFRQVGLLD